MTERKIGAWFVRTNPQRLNMVPSVDNSGLSFPPRPFSVGADDYARLDEIHKINQAGLCKLRHYKAQMYRAQLKYRVIEFDEYEALMKSLEQN